MTSSVLGSQGYNSGQTKSLSPVSYIIGGETDNSQKVLQIHVRLGQKLLECETNQDEEDKKGERWKMLLFDRMSTLLSQNVYFIYWYLNWDLGK